MSDFEEKQPPSLCRLCLSYTTRPISLLNNNKSSEMLEALTTIRVLPTDDISTVSCFKCVLNLKLAFFIQQNILKAEQRFRERVKLEFNEGEEKTEVNLLARQDSKEIDKLSLKPANFESKIIDSFYTRNICILNKKSDSLLVNKTEFPLDFSSVTIKEERDELSFKPVDLLESKVEGPYICGICGIEKKTKILLRSHNYNVHQFTTCTICKKKIKKIRFRAHMILHSVDLLSENGAQDSVATSKLQENSSKVKGLYDCNICGKDLKTMTKLKIHKFNVHKFNVKRHKNNKSSVCDICGATVKDLGYHLRYKHQNKDLKCKFCNESFKYPKSRAIHELRDHNGDQKFICDFCGKKFYMKKHLKIHVEGVHFKQKTFPCLVCNVNYSSRYSLKTHMRRHTNETPFKCEVCGDSFRHKVSLKTHLKSKHQLKEELTCECQKCGKMFGSKAALISHGRIH